MWKSDKFINMVIYLLIGGDKDKRASKFTDLYSSQANKVIRATYILSLADHAKFIDLFWVPRKKVWKIAGLIYFDRSFRPVYIDRSNLSNVHIWWQNIQRSSDALAFSKSQMNGQLCSAKWAFWFLSCKLSTLGPLCACCGGQTAVTSNRDRFIDYETRTFAIFHPKMRSLATNKKLWRSVIDIWWFRNSSVGLWLKCDVIWLILIWPNRVRNQGHGRKRIQGSRSSTSIAKFILRLSTNIFRLFIKDLWRLARWFGEIWNSSGLSIRHSVDRSVVVKKPKRKLIDKPFVAVVVSGDDIF